MENRLRKTKRKRFLAFLYDIIFIILLSFSVYPLFGNLIKHILEINHNPMYYVLFIIVIPYLFFGELLFKNSLGKFLFGIKVVNHTNYEKPSILSFIKRGLFKMIWPVESFALLFSKKKKRLGDLWGNTIVINKIENKFNLTIRFIIGTLILIGLYFTFYSFLGYENAIRKGNELSAREVKIISTFGLLEEKEQIIQFHSQSGEYDNVSQSGNFYSNKRVASYWIDRYDELGTKYNYAFYSEIDTMIAYDYSDDWSTGSYLLIKTHNSNEFNVFVNGEHTEVSNFFKGAIEEWNKNTIKRSQPNQED